MKKPLTVDEFRESEALDEKPGTPRILRAARNMERDWIDVAGDLLDRAMQENRSLKASEQRDYDAAKEENRKFRKLAERLEEDSSEFERTEGRLAAERDRLGFHPGGDVSNERATSGHRAGQWLSNELRALVGSGTTGGGAYTPADSRAFFDLLGASAVALRAGFRTIRTDKDSLIVPRLTADTGANWTAEAATITQSSLSADQVTATPRKLAGIERLSNEVINDSEPAILDVVGQSLVRSISLKLDLGILEGSGTPPEIRGLKNTSGIQTVSMGANGLTPTNLDPFADAIGALEAANANATAIIMQPRTWKTLIKVKEVSGSAKPIMQDSAGSGAQGVARSIYGVPVYLSSQLSITETQGTSTDASSAYVVQGDQCVVVMRQDVRVERDSSRLFNSDESEVRAILRADFAVANPSAVVRITGLRP